MFFHRQKFEIINFDACDMATVEVIAALEPYADYLVASAEDEQGYGQEYTTWLNAVKEKPEMNGFELGKAIVDATIDFYCRTDFDSYDVSTIEATLAVIDTENFKERLLGELIELDNTLVNQAKNAGRRNNRFNFYDEIYALSNAYKYAQGDISCYDLGNYVGSLSALQSEMDNYTASQISAQKNVQILHKKDWKQQRLMQNQQVIY